ncbi:HD domain-containing protein [candidate division KSB1 bacterium]
MRDRLIELIPEFDEISDADLKEKTVNVWIKALKLANMSPDDMLRMPFTLIKLSIEKDINFVTHVRGVTGVAMAAGKLVRDLYKDVISINMDYLAAGALLHDVGKVIEVSETKNGWIKSTQGKIVRHPFSGVGLCFDEGIPDEVMHIIAVHSKEGDGGFRTPEAWILHHADFINFEIFR